MRLKEWTFTNKVDHETAERVMDEIRQEYPTPAAPERLDVAAVGDQQIAEFEKRLIALGLNSSVTYDNTGEAGV